jgi:small glutamine-rich tetratricopeptide repeat-containing protein alpha
MEKQKIFFPFLMSAKQQLAAAICSFLNESVKDKTISEENKEGIEVSIQCIQEAFGLSDTTSDANLMQIFNLFISAKAKQTAKPEKVESNPEAVKKSEELKSQGNKLLAAKKFEEAIEKYTEAIDLYESAVYYSNRAAAYSQCGRHEMASNDAKKALEIDPSFSKAFSRLGHAEFCLGNYSAAVDAYKRGLEKDPNNASLKQSLAAAEQKNATSVATSDSNKSNSSGGGNPFGGMDFASMMSDPNFMNMGISILT